MRRRIFLVSLTLLLSQFCFAQEQEEIAPDIRIKFYPSFSLDYLYRDSLLNTIYDAYPYTPGAVIPYPSESIVLGKITLSSYITFFEKYNLFFELENRIIDAGKNLALGRDNLRLFFEQLYFETLLPQLNNLLLRFGAQDIKYTIRPEDESLVLDVTESEAFFKIIDEQYPFFVRDTIEPVGIFIQGYPSEVTGMRFFALTNIERGKFAHDESLFGLIFDFIPSKNSRYSGICLLTTGGSPNPDGTQGRDQAVFTTGFGIHLKAQNIELYHESYIQLGEAGRNPYRETLKARGAALRTGFQVNFPHYGGVPYFDAQFIYVSGDNRHFDTKETRFLSYENVDRFLILQSNEFGLDWDSNYMGWAFEVGALFRLTEFYIAPVDPKEMPLEKRIFETAVPISVKFGWFKMARNLIVLGHKTDDLGMEVDISIKYVLHENLLLNLQAAKFFNSRIFHLLSLEEGNETNLLVISFQVIH